MNPRDIQNLIERYFEDILLQVGVLLYNWYCIIYPPANGANERSEICVVSRGGNFFN